ncbi:MAG: hypothetical protein AAF990_05535 [Bacteroidota bacterium]
MNVFDSARLIIYRINKKGLEIFLVNTGSNWELPKGNLSDSPQTISEQDRFIELDPVSQADGQLGQAVAVEGDWHEIPSIRGMIKDDVRIVKDQIKQRFPELEQGTYFAVKEAFKKVLPEEYAFLKELKDVILDRNQAKYI